MAAHRLYIEFRNADGSKECYRSPLFKVRGNLMNDDSKLGQTFDELVVDGDDETDFFVHCDMQGSGDNIVWNMFDPYSKEWVDDLMKVWKRKLKFDLPPWDQWTIVADVGEAYE